MILLLIFENNFEWSLCFLQLTIYEDHEYHIVIIFFYREQDSLGITRYYEWFRFAVQKWLVIAQVKATARVTKAVEVDMVSWAFSNTYMTVSIKFTYLGSCVSSTENDITTRQSEAGSTIDRLSVIWKSNLSDKIKCNFFKAAVVVLLYGCTTWMLIKRLEKSLMAIAQECYELYWTNPGSNISQNSICMATYLPSLKPSKSDKQDIQGTAGGVRTNS